MPRKTTAHAELDQLRQTVATERIRARDVDAELEVAKQRVEDISDDLTEAFADDDTKLVQQRRQELQAAEAEVEDLAHRSKAAGLRVERSQRAVDNFAAERGRDLLDEREQPARTVAAELTVSVHQTLKLAKAYVAERQTQDQLVAAVPGATPRADGPASSHPWESRLKDLERAVAEVSECPPPLPRWRGLEHRGAEDVRARRLQLQRRKKLTADERVELARINRELGVSAPSVEVA